MAVTTSNAPQEYDVGVRKTIPYYDDIHANTIDLIRHAGPAPKAWLDTGCGTGALVKRALPLFPETNFALADPSEEMLQVARAGLEGEPRCRYYDRPSQDLEFSDGSFDVVTALLAHHYLDPAGRERALKNIFRMLGRGGIFVTCEHTAPRTEKGRELLLSRWKDFQYAAGKSLEKAEAHVARYNVSYFPISMSEHIGLLSGCGFSSVEVLWASYSDVVFYAIK